MAEVVVETLLIGRQRQLSWVRGWVAELAAGTGRAIVIEGEPGIGKSALVRAAAADGEAAGCQLFWAACDELSQAFPLLPLLDALEARAVPGRHGQPTIAEMLRAQTLPGGPVDVVSAAAERLLTLVDEFCAAAPVVLVVDDLQWADAATVRTFGRLVRTVSQLPLLLIGTMRPVPRRDDLVALRRTIDPAGLVRLHCLSDAEVGEFIGRAVDGKPGLGLLHLAGGAAGNPLYLTELVDALVRGGALVTEGGVVEVIGERAPESLSAAINDRLEFLSAPVREVLRAVALLGVDFSVSELSVVTGRRVNELMPVLDEAMLAGVLREQGTELAFRHPLIREALYGAMPASLRAAWHHDAGRALAEAGAPPDQVARQLLPALESPDATPPPVDEWVVRWLVDSVQHLVSQAPNAAIPLLRWVVGDRPAGVDPHDMLACRLADALYRVGDPAGATMVASGALAYVTRADLQVELHWTLAQCRALDGRAEESIEALEHALSSPGVGLRQRARLLALTARTHNRIGQIDTASHVAEEALVAGTAAGDAWATGWALGVLTMVHVMRGQSSRALPLFERALAVAEGDPALADLRLVLQINQASALGELDRYDDAINAAQRARQLADETSNVVRLTQAQSVLGELLFDVGRWDDALAEIDPAPGVAKDPVVECSDRGVAATIRLHRGDADAGQQLADAEQFAALLGDRVIGSLTLARALECEQADEPGDALGVLMAGLADSAEEIEETADLLADAVRLAVAVGDVAAARSIVARAEAAAQVSDAPHRRAVAQHCRGLLERDVTALLDAADHYGLAGRPLPQAQALEAAGVVLADAGDLPGARNHFTAAFAVYSALNAGWDLARTQARFRTYGIRRGPSVRHRRSRRGWGSLTPTELRIVSLVAEGMSNPQIAARLFLSRRTVQTHVSHILAKLDLHSRIDIAREASRRDVESGG